jgi:hypothetical protein
MKPKQTMEISEEEGMLLKMLRENPEMMEPMKGLLEEVRDEGGKLERADEAEEALVKRVREIGRLGLTGWAKRKAEQAEEQPPEAGARRGSKKSELDE